MSITVDKSAVDFQHDIVDNLVGEVQGWVKLASILIVALYYNIFEFVRTTPALCMGGCIKLRNDPDTPDFGIVDNGFDLSPGVGP